MVGVRVIGNDLGRAVRQLKNRLAKDGLLQELVQRRLWNSSDRP